MQDNFFFSGQTLYLYLKSCEIYKTSQKIPEHFSRQHCICQKKICQNKLAICFDIFFPIITNFQPINYTLALFLQAVAKVIDLILLQLNLFLCCKSLTSKWTNTDLHGLQLHPLLLHWRLELPTLKGQVDIVYDGVYLVLMDIWAFLEEKIILNLYILIITITTILQKKILIILYPLGVIV